MRTRAFGMLGLALVLAALSVYLTHRWILTQVGAHAGSTPAVAAAPAAITQIVVAAASLPYGGKLRREHVRLADWPADSVPHGAFTAIDEIFGTAGDVGTDRGAHTVLRALAKNEPILKSRISGFGGRAILSTLIAPGLRAAAIRVNDVNGVAGFVLPGDRVDVLLTRDLHTGNRQRQLVTDVLLQSMKVLGIDQDNNEDREKPSVPRTVTLEVTQADAQKLTLAQRLGTLSLILRPGAGAEITTPRTMTAGDMPLGAPPPPAPAKPTPERAAKRQSAESSVRIVRGLEPSIYEVAIDQPLAVAAPPAPEPVSRTVEAKSASPAAAPRRRPQPPLAGARLEAATGGASTPATDTMSGRGLGAPTVPLTAPEHGPGGDG